MSEDTQEATLPVKNKWQLTNILGLWREH